MIEYEKLKEKILNLLNEQLPGELTYHGTHHTLDVLDVCNAYIEREGIKDRDALLLRTGVLFHDFGFTRSFDDHERNGAMLAENVLPDFGFGQEEIKIVEGLIGTPTKPITPAVTTNGSKFGISEMIIIRKERKRYAINSAINPMANAKESIRFFTKYFVPFKKSRALPVI